jgi:folate-binding protein YgfZ
LPSRGVIAVSGPDRVGFLQGLVSNDVTQAAPGRAVWAAMLTPQGKYLDDFFIFADGGRLLLDCEADRVEAIVPRLTRFRLRAKVEIAPVPLQVIAASDPLEGIAAPDPRHQSAGWRALVPELPPGAGDAAVWDETRLSLGLPDGGRDLEREKTVLLEAGFDELHGVSWTKGCYLGQELTARTKYRGLVKRRLVPVAVEGELPAPGTLIFRDEAEAGVMRSGRGGRGLALLRLDALDAALRAGEATLRAEPPAWMVLA